MTLTHTLEKTDDRARASTVKLPRGSFRTPIFMPVGTHATVKAMTPSELDALGSEVVLANAYHLMLRPRRRASAGLGWSSSVHGVAQPHADRLRRLSGIQPAVTRRHFRR